MTIPKILSRSWLISLTASFLVAFGNISFFTNVIKTYPITLANIPFLMSLVVLTTMIIILLLSLVSFKFTTKPTLILVLLISSSASYFMNSYGIVLDEDMLRNTFQTNLTEATELINLKLTMYFILLGVLPSYFIYKVEIKPETIKEALLNKVISLFVPFIIIALIVFSFSNYYASFFREHKSLRFYTNPIFYIYSTGKYISSSFKIKLQDVAPIGIDAVKKSNSTHPKLVILVVGETARADRFGLNAYKKDTTPLLAKQNVLSFKNMSSCGTSTAHSVPCMFSKFARSDFDDEKGAVYENALDILARTGVNVLWRDNNSDSKGVALRVNFENYRTSKNNTVCDTECRDEGMLVGLQDYINKQEGDILIVLHQLGNHGPAYYKRYPLNFEKFTPTCKSKNLETCSTLQINNSYDNAIVYTDYFLNKTIELLKQNEQKFSSSLFYVSDHGESLGENNIYLHGLPYFIAPKEQTNSAAVFWSSKTSMIDTQYLNSHTPVSHDNVFHSLLGLFEISTSLYNKDLDIFSSSKKP